MKWLVVVEGRCVGAELLKLLDGVAAHRVPFSEPIPLSDDEVSVEVEGPVDLPSRLTDAVVKGVYPASDLTLY